MNENITTAVNKQQRTIKLPLMGTSTITPTILLSLILHPLSECNFFLQTGFQIGKQLQG